MLPEGARVQSVGDHPAMDLEVTEAVDSGCVTFSRSHVANALQDGCSDCPTLASLDADLQRVIPMWKQLPSARNSSVTAFHRIEFRDGCRGRAPEFDEAPLLL